MFCFSLIKRVILSAGAMLIFSGEISIRSVHYNLTLLQREIPPVCLVAGPSPPNLLPGPNPKINNCEIRGLHDSPKQRTDSKDETLKSVSL
ncbi:uncharacterized protein N7479_007842 [Penicillium vulpinum]|uniref:uncharacterized protein n=1 Tax=Penicillium vulpinum TaxID=29845 RepID=UPI0025493615|nr:uncharacterized protein N7479_007842 [Penicillium vulpinum]KAJ5960692.1 hypothetical protein N7479_007842 [Penicillium vulpinum]